MASERKKQANDLRGGIEGRRMRSWSTRGGEVEGGDEDGGLPHACRKHFPETFGEVTFGEVKGSLCGEFFCATGCRSRRLPDNGLLCTSVRSVVSKGHAPGIEFLGSTFWIMDFVLVGNTLLIGSLHS